MKRVIYAGAQVRHLFRIIDLETGCEVQTVAADDKLTTGSDAEFGQLRQNHAETWAQLRAQHEAQVPVNGRGSEGGKARVREGAEA